MISNIENKIEDVRLQECFLKKQVFLGVNHFARNIYEMETVNLGLCYIGDFLEIFFLE